MAMLNTLDQRICYFLRDFPNQPQYRRRYEDDAHRDFLRKLFEFMCNSDEAYIPLLFPNGVPAANEAWSLSEAQGAAEGAEYSEAARGKPCGHILKSGEPSYRCRTCTADETCVLCSRCFEASDHEGHQVTCSVSTGNAGCCDCGDEEAWLRPVHCQIHSARPGKSSNGKDKAPEAPQLPPELLQSIRITISRLLDYLNDVISCSPEQLRIAKTEELVMANERESRLNSPPYTDGSGAGAQEEIDKEFAVILWNDEKHANTDVQNQIARAAKMSLSRGGALANLINTVGRAVIKYDTDVTNLVNIARKIEATNITVTIRSARDTFREQMCAAIIGWLSDIAGCTVGTDTKILRAIICDELLQPWRKGSQAPHLDVGQEGLHDHEIEEQEFEDDKFINYLFRVPRVQPVAVVQTRGPNTIVAANDANNGGAALEMRDEEDEVDTMEIEADLQAVQGRDQDLDTDNALETHEATLAGYAPPPPPPASRLTSLAPQSGGASSAHGLMSVPQTPKKKGRAMPLATHPPDYWLMKPEGFSRREDLASREDLWQRTRIDWLILFDLRMWKNIRCIMRDLFIGTVVNIPEFKRLLGLRFAALYTPLAQLYLIADREPDYSIISLSLQMLTTPSITAEVIDRGNFLTALMAILYTFITTRQVSYAERVDANATLALEAGVGGNRRLHHFWHDMKCLLGSPLAQERIRQESRYTLQFLDLVKLHQGIVPNKRVTDAHVEYESDEWINAGQMVKEVNRIVHEFAQAFNGSFVESVDLARALHQAARAATVNSIGAERTRFEKNALGRETRFKELATFEFDNPRTTTRSGEELRYRVVDYEVAQGFMSFHHPLHNLVSWLVEYGRTMTTEELRDAFTFDETSLALSTSPPLAQLQIPALSASDYTLAMFDIPLRQLAWLAQMKAGLWVRNGLTLRHQALNYRGVSQRELTYQRDIFMMQVAFSICDPATMLASMIDRFALLDWATGGYALPQGTDEHQMVDVAESLVNLLTVILCDRQALLPISNKAEADNMAITREISQMLCFEPLSHSALVGRLTERVRESNAFETRLEQMTHYNEPRGLEDSGTLTLKKEFLPLIDPYIAPYNRDQREEAERIYRKHKAEATGQKLEDVVFEPVLPTLTGTAFVNFDAFTKTPLFMQVLYYFLQYCLSRPSETTRVPATKLDGFLQSVLHLVLVSIVMDETTSPEASHTPSFVLNAIGGTSSEGGQSLGRSIIPLLNDVLKGESYSAFEPKVWRILYLLQQRAPEAFATVSEAHNLTFGKRQSAQSKTNDDEREAKKRAAQARGAQALAKMKEQQKSFMANQDIDWGDSDDSSSAQGINTPAEDEEGVGEKCLFFPSGDCIHCKEPCGDSDRESRLYGMFSLLTENKILRQTPQWDPDWSGEIHAVPTSLDRSAEHIRPFGVSGQNLRTIERVQPDGSVTTTEHRVLGKGFPYDSAVQGPVSVGCGSHLMHFSCFEEYNRSTRMRHQSQTARHQPEKLAYKEFLCPFCKALGNAFLPIIWKARPIHQPDGIGWDLSQSFERWLLSGLHETLGKHSRANVPGALPIETEEIELQRQESVYEEYTQRTLETGLSSEIPLFKKSTNPYPLTVPEPCPLHGSTMPFGGLPAFAPQGRDTTQNPLPLAELYRTYGRLRETIKENKLKTRFEYPAYDSRTDGMDGLTYTDVLSKALGFSISSLEISQRGVEAQHTLLDKINPSALMHLTVLSETVQSYISIGGLRNNGQTKTNREFVQTQQQQMRQLFIGLEGISGLDRNILTMDFKNLPPLLLEDPFIFLTEASVYLGPALQIAPEYILRLCYIAEIVRVILSCCSIEGGKTGVVSCLTTQPKKLKAEGSKWETDAFDEPAGAGAFRDFVGLLLSMHHEASSVGPGPVQQDFGSLSTDHPFWDQVRDTIATYALPFLRKATILMHVRFGIDFSNVTPLLDPASSELDRLSSILRLPPLPQLIETLTHSEPQDMVMRDIIGGWIKHWAWTQEGKHVSTTSEEQTPAHPRFPFSLSHPGIFELIGLPTKYATLADAAVQLRCPTMNLELTDPALCLWCGEIFCSQASCCHDLEESRSPRGRKEGGCRRHRKKCGGAIGIFILIRKCYTLFLRDDSGSMYPAPYLDKHGEEDPSLRHHEQLYLSMKRADAGIRKVWLEGGIEGKVARKLDAEHNTGGWDTL